MRSTILASRFFFGTTNKPLLKTALYDYHVNVLKGKMIEFAGYEMPVLYPDGVLKEHLHCRENASFFDVSHMGQVKIRGKNAVDFIEKLVVGDVRNKPKAESFLSLILNEKGGIIDDTIVTNFGDHVHMVVNGANKFIDLKHMEQVKNQYFSGADIKIEYLDKKALIAIQGPKAVQVMQGFTSTDLSKVGFMKYINVPIPKLNIEIGLCRCGYTGEDGFELSVDNEKAVQLSELLLSNKILRPAGLGARDSLRVEGGLCLHGNDMDNTKTPSECSLMWTVRKTNKDKQKYTYLGQEVVDKQRKDGVQQKRVGFQVEGSGILRPICDVKDNKDQNIGFVCTGSYSPILKKGIGMCFVKTEFSKLGTKLIVSQKGKKYNIVLTKMPFVAHRYFRLAEK